MEKFLPLLQVALIVLKLCGVITWSWWLVLLPCIIGLVCGMIIVIAYAIAWVMWESGK